MAASATVKLTLTTTENPGGFAWPAEKSYTNAAPPLLADLMTLSTTPVAITIPSGTEWVIIIPPATNANNIKISGAVGETVGAILHPTRPIYLPVPSASPSIFLFAAAAVSNCQIYFV